MKLTRRDFIKTAGAATGTMAISSVIPMPAWAENQNGGAILTAARWGPYMWRSKTAKLSLQKAHYLKPYRTHCSKPRRIRYIPTPV